MKNTFLILISVFAAQAFAGGGSSVGVGNPASTTCVNEGGHWVALMDYEMNEHGICQFQQGIIEEWTLYRHLTETRTLATEAFLARQNSNDSDSPEQICQELNGQLTLWHVPMQMKTFQFCQFQDGSLIEAKTLLTGSRVNAELAEVLSK